jgi:hypothetical protein
MTKALKDSSVGSAKSQKYAVWSSIVAAISSIISGGAMKVATKRSQESLTPALARDKSAYKLH